MNLPQEKRNNMIEEIGKLENNDNIHASFEEGELEQEYTEEFAWNKVKEKKQSIQSSWYVRLKF